MAELFWLNDEQWAAVDPIVSIIQGKKRNDDRTIISGIVHRFREDCGWRHMPREYGPHMTVYNRFNRWRHYGIWQQIFAALMECQSPPLQADTPSIGGRAHRKTIARARRFSTL